MNFILDTHTHTTASGHAYHTLTEMIDTAKERGLQLLAITDHAPAMPGTLTHPFYFDNFRVIRREYGNLKLLMGAEANIISYDGDIDLSAYLLKYLDLVIASFHKPCLEAKSMEENTRAYLKTMENPYVDIIGHPDDSRIPINYEQLVEAAKKHDIILEVNNSSLNPNGFRENAKVNYCKMLDLCKHYEVPISLGSDSHVKDDIANFTFAKPLLEEANFPEELVLNTSTDRFWYYINKRRTHRS